MTANMTPEALAELWRLYSEWQETVKPYGFRLMPSGEYYALAAAAVNALPALMDAAAFLDEVRGHVARGALCPMCSTGMTRQTVGMVCQLCGTDYARPEYASLRRDAEQTTKAALFEAARLRREQRLLDNLPCPECGGDRLRADFTTPGRCHVPRADR